MFPYGFTFEVLILFELEISIFALHSFHEASSFFVSEIKWNKSFCIIGSHLHTLQLLIHICVVIFIYGYMRTSSCIICV